MKLKIIIPSILLVPCLFGCKNKNAYSFSFHSDYCELDNKSEYSKSEPETVTLNLTLKEDYQYCAVPDDVIVLFDTREGIKDQDYTYTPVGDKDPKSATITLTVNANVSITAKFSDSDNNFRIDPKKYEEAIGLTSKDLKYVQRANLRGYLTDQSIFNLTYFESYVSPTVYNQYGRSIYGQFQSIDEKYVAKEGNKYYRYIRSTSSSPWEKTEVKESEFVKPSDISVKSTLESGNITYELVSQNYNRDLQSYEFTAEDSEQTQYSVVMSFYNNQLTFLSYSNSASVVNFETISFTYREITPTLPKV